MFNLAECQKRIKFTEFFGEWFREELVRMRDDRDAYPYKDRRFVYSNLADRIIEYGIKFVDRQIISESNEVRIVADVPRYDNDDECHIGVCWIWEGQTKWLICRRLLLDCVDVYSWDLATAMTERFLSVMRERPGYLKSFDDIPEGRD